MPYPILLLAGAALSAAGTGASVAGAQKSQSAMNAAVENEVGQQQQYAAKGRNIFEQSLQGSAPQTAQQQMQQGQDKALSDYRRLQSLDLNGSGQAAPFQTDKAALNTDTARTNLSNAAQARLQGYSEWDLQQAIKDLQARGQLGVLGNFAQSTANLLPYQLQSAQHSGDALTGLGSILSAAGGLVGGLGALESPTSGAAGATATGGGSYINDAESFTNPFLKKLPSVVTTSSMV